jgi:CBS domain containing-hemolysin-like protein
VETDLVGSSLFLIVCLILSIFFSAAETSITATPRTRLLALCEAQPHRKKSLGWLLKSFQRALSVTLVGNNLVNIAASSLATSVALSLFGEGGLWIAIALMTVLIIIFCEILPKSLAMLHPDRVLLIGLPGLRVAGVILAPLIWTTQAAVRLVGRILGLSLAQQTTFMTREEIEQIVREGGVSGALEEGERKMISGVISFEETRVSEIMVPRIDITALSVESSVGLAYERFRESGHSRMPVFEGDLDHIVGILYVKDLLVPLASGRLEAPAREHQRKCLFVPETMRTADLFEMMQKSRVHMALVVDEYGGTAGLLTLEDLLEEIVGDIQDEYDQETPPISKEADGSYLIQGQVNLEDLSETLRYSFDFEDVDTVAGMVLSLFGDFPRAGQRMAYGPYDVVVVEVKNHRILQVRLVPRVDAEEQEKEMEVWE